MFLEDANIQECSDVVLEKEDIQEISEDDGTQEISHMKDRKDYDSVRTGEEL